MTARVSTQVEKNTKSLDRMIHTVNATIERMEPWQGEDKRIATNIEQVQAPMQHFEHQLNLLGFDIVMLVHMIWGPQILKVVSKAALVAWSNKKQRHMGRMTWNSYAQLFLFVRN